MRALHHSDKFPKPLQFATRIAQPSSGALVSEAHVFPIANRVNESERQPKAGSNNSLWQVVRQPRNRLGEIVPDHHNRKQDQENESCLVDPLLDVHADVAAHQAFN
jgi:hypothetical protein